MIKEKLKTYIKENPIVNVRMANYKISVMGEDVYRRQVYTTGIMLKGTFTPESSQTIGNNGNPVEDPLVFNTLYYFNYKFYTTLACLLYTS